MADQPLIDPLLLSNFIHQIINPLNGVIGTLDNIIDGTTKESSRRQQRLEAVRAQLVHWIEMVRNLAFLSQLTSDQGALGLKEKATDVVIPMVVIEAAQFFQERALQQNMHIDLTDKKTQFIVKGHLDLLRQVFMNLFDNAIKYGDSDTRITVTPHAQKRTGNLIIEVSSIGCGFDPDEREKIFGLGYRGRAAQEIKASGTGLGLFICKRILEIAHDTTIEAEHSQTTRKTTFRIRFPNHSIGDPYVEGPYQQTRSFGR